VLSKKKKSFYKKAKELEKIEAKRKKVFEAYE
jgi:hypothetical protein